MSLFSTYKQAIQEHFPTSYPNWTPTTRQTVGDYGTLVDGIFHRRGNLNDVNINVLPLTESNTTNEQFTSSKDIGVVLIGKGEIINGGIASAKAGVKINFDSNKGIFFNAVGVSRTRIRNYEEIGNELIKRSRAANWDLEYLIITDVHTAQKGVIAISEGEAAELELEADSDSISEINLGDINLALSIKKNEKSKYVISTGNGELTLMIGFSKVKRSVIGTRSFKPVSKNKYLPMYGDTANKNLIKKSKFSANQIEYYMERIVLP